MRTHDVFGLTSAPRSLDQPPIPYQRVGFSWGAVAAGVAIVVALSVWFAEVGLALNLGLIDGSSDAQTIGIVNAIGWVIGGLLAVFAGAWVAGRMSTARTAVGGGIHGLAVWATASVVTLMLAVSAAGTLGSGMVQLVGKGLDSAGQAVSLVAPNWDTVKEELEDAKVALTDEAASGQGGAQTANADNRFVDESRLLELAGKHFTLEGSQLTEEERGEFVKLVSARLNISPDATERTLTQWNNVWESSVQRFEEAKNEAVAVADDARGYAAAAAGWAALAMLLGALAAAFGGAHGTACALRSAVDDRHPDSARVATTSPSLRDDVIPPPPINPAINPANKPSGQSSKSLR